MASALDSIYYHFLVSQFLGCYSQKTQPQQNNGLVYYIRIYGIDCDFFLYVYFGKGEPEEIVSIFEKLRVKVRIVDAKEKFFNAFKGITDPEEMIQSWRETAAKNKLPKMYIDQVEKRLKESLGING